MGAFSVVPGQIRLSSTRVSAGADAVRRADALAVDAARAATTGSGAGPLASALMVLAVEVERCGREFTLAVEAAAASLQRSADTYVASDDEVRVHTAHGQP